MSDKMNPVSFEEMITKCLTEYKSEKTIFGIPAEEIEGIFPFGPAAGPHTQLCRNIVSAYAAGASCFELKTVQILEGDALGIKKPCIYVGHEVYNTEWSTELTVEQARDEYIKAFLCIQVLSRELKRYDNKKSEFVMSVGYDLAGIQSKKINDFINDMMKASTTKEWKKDIQFLKDNIILFENIGMSEIVDIEVNDKISDTVTLSTMHGCLKSEIEKIAKYLIEEKQLNTYIKMNPTLIGAEKAEEILTAKGYSKILFNKHSFETDISLNEAVEIIKNCQSAAKENNKKFGVKLTNTFPVKIQNKELDGEEMYMSGPALYGLSISVAKLLGEKFNGKINISYSGGADSHNIVKILEAGIAPVTVSSYLLKPGGYKNLTKMKKEIAKIKQIPDELNLEKLDQLILEVKSDTETNQKEIKTFATSNEYSILCGKCNNCVDVCPNRANIKIMYKNEKAVLHRDRLCNECGCCASSCILGHLPYMEKCTIFESKDAFMQSNNYGIFIDGKELKVRYPEDISEEIKEKISQIILLGKESGKF